MNLISPAFKDKERIPKKFTCDGRGVNPALEIANASEKAESFVLIVDDPDAPAQTFVHWLLANISPERKCIGEDSSPSEAVVGENSGGSTDYYPPCPPSGKHRYFFKLYALDTQLDLEEGFTKSELEEAIERHVVVEAKLTGIYGS